MQAVEFVEKAIEIWRENGRPSLSGYWKTAHSIISKLAFENGIKVYGFGSDWGDQNIYALVDGVYAKAHTASGAVEARNVANM